MKPILSFAFIIALAAVPVFAHATESDDSMAEKIREFREVQDKAEKTFEMSRKRMKSETEIVRKTTSAVNVSELFAQRKEQAQKMIEVMIEHAKSLKEKISEAANIEENRKTELLRLIEDRITKLNELKKKIDAATSWVDLKALMGGVRELEKKEIKLKARTAMVLSHIAKFEKSMIGRAESKSERIADKITDLKTAGKDTSALEAKLVMANGKIDSAKSALINLKTKVQTDQTINKPADIQKELASIKDMIKEAYELFRQIVTSIPEKD